MQARAVRGRAGLCARQARAYSPLLGPSWPVRLPSLRLPWTGFVSISSRTFLPVLGRSFVFPQPGRFRARSHRSACASRPSACSRGPLLSQSTSRALAVQCRTPPVNSEGRLSRGNFVFCLACHANARGMPRLRRQSRKHDTGRLYAEWHHRASRLSCALGSLWGTTEQLLKRLRRSRGVPRSRL